MHVVVNGWFIARPDVGSGQYLRRLLTHLESQPTHQFTMLAPSEANRASNDAGEARKMRSRVHEVALPAWPKPLAKLWWEQIIVPYMARRLRADLVWVPYWASPLWQPCPTVVTVHDVIPALLPAYRGSGLQRIYTWLVSQTARRAAAVITVSQASRRDIVEHLHIRAEKVHVVYNGLDQAPFSPNQPSPETLRAKLQLPAFFFLYLGGFDVRKNVTAVLKAYKMYLDQGGNPNIHMVIAGQLPHPDDALHPDPRKTVAELALTPFVHFCGYIEEQDKSVLYAMATAFLFPSLYEGFGLPVIEAMAAGAPVITSAR